MAENDIEALAVEQAAKAIHAAHMADKGPLHEWKWEEASKPFYYRLAHAAITALRSTTAEPNPAPAAWMYKRPSRLSPNHTETRLSSEAWPEWFANDWTETPLFTHPTDSAAKDAEIAAYREALEAIDAFGKRHPGHGHSCHVLAAKALANRGEATDA